VGNGWALLDFGALTAKSSQQYLDTDEAYGIEYRRILGRIAAEERLVNG
jgi:hypothetical protein